MKTPVPTLHDDLIAQILLLLPVRSLLRSKCVCKSWLSLISDPQFAKSHFDLAATPTHRLLLHCTRIHGQSVIESLDIEAKLGEDSAVARLDLNVQPWHSLETWGSCRGFILLADLERHVVTVWNPSTGIRREIALSRSFWNYRNPPIAARNQISGGFKTLMGKGIGYDESRDDYLIVLIGLDNSGLVRIEVFSLKTNASYFICGIEGGYIALGSDYSPGLFLNQSLHWLVRPKENKFPLVLAFNLIDRSLSEILLPYELLTELGPIPLNIIGGCLSLSVLGFRMTKIWVMKEYKVQSSWTKSFVLPLDNCPYCMFAPICFTKGVDVLGSTSGGRLIKFNNRGDLIEGHAYAGKYYAKPMHYDIYRESLLSLPSYFAEDEEEATKDEESTEDKEAGEDEEVGDKKDEE